ncbi:hypothetical protein MKQ68_01710 [Chitinophaga horti]|uniref:5-bromo-4-chloroindolyl phosphate hydrolysis protein n=1 Tax=Chitinophaga horti TaxID=2920382 RepID=A0ABY6J2E7_9BACT|nr:hypothetical protein [Chitinophaga horti]UYQ93810.1 hypothetical protein MKQ68_01710 [Chitinophaga horti]
MTYACLCINLPETFWWDLLISIVGAFIGFYFAYIIYKLSIKHLRADRLKYVASLLESIIRTTVQQGHSCKQHAEKIATNPFGYNFLPLVASSDTKRLAERVDQEGVYHAYLDKYKRKASTYKEFKNLYGYIDYIDQLLEDLIRTNEKILNATWERKNQYASNFTAIREIVNILSIDPEIQEKQPEVYRFSQNLFDQLQQANPDAENLVDSYNIVVKPLTSYLLINANLHPRITELVFLLQKAADYYRGIELAAQHNAKDYDEYSKSLIEKGQELDQKSAQLRRDFAIK